MGNEWRTSTQDSWLPSQVSQLLKTPDRRAVVFGYIGARSCKWLYRVSCIAAPSEAPVQRQEYLYFNSQVGKHNQLYHLGISIQEMPVSSAIMSPIARDVVIHDGKIKVKGWAYSGGGRWPERVEVSSDGGFVWYPHFQTQTLIIVGMKFPPRTSVRNINMRGGHGMLIFP